MDMIEMQDQYSNINIDLQNMISMCVYNISLFYKL